MKRRKKTREESEAEETEEVVEGIDASMLEGLIVNTNKVLTSNGIKTYLSDERPMVVDDVLSIKDCGGFVLIVSNDGQKHKVLK